MSSTTRVKTFWSGVPGRSVVVFFLGVFFIFSIIGFAVDLMETGRQPIPRFVLSVVLSGVSAMIYAAAGTILRRKMWMVFVPVFLVHMVLMNYLGHRFPSVPSPVPMQAPDIARLHGRLTFDAIAIIFAMALGYTCFVTVTITEGRRYFRVHAEMALAADIHRVLVPPIDSRIDGFEFYGSSVPSGEVGGDLIDLFQQGRGWIAYIADVSGHGVAPGVMMAMVKSAARMQLSSGEKSTALLERMNSVLYPIKKPEMFVTFAYLACNGERVEYSSAGHPAILHYHAATREITELGCSNLPVAILDGQPFAAESVECAPGDMFVLITDGLLEITNAKDEEFGLAGVKSVVSAHGGESLKAIHGALLTAAKEFGQPADDQSLMLVRRCVPARTA